MGVSLLLREWAEEGLVIQQSEQSLWNLYSRPFHIVIGPDGVSDLVNFGIFQDV